MAVVSRSDRPNRLKGLRSAHRGLVALLALSAGAGCGQSLLRPANGPGLAAQSLGESDEATPGRQLAWNDPDKASRTGAGASTAGGLLFAASAPIGPISLDTMTAGPPPNQPAETFAGPTFAKTTWNGWKRPTINPLAKASEPLMAAIPMPIPAPSRTGTADDRLMVASEKSTIEPPRPIANSSVPTPAVDSLLTACREARIVPPLRKVSRATTAVATPGSASDTGKSLDPLQAACDATKFAPPTDAPIIVSQKVETPVPDPVPVPVPAETAVEAPGPTAVGEASPVPKVIEVEPMPVSSVAEADPGPVAEPLLTEITETERTPQEFIPMPVPVPVPVPVPTTVATAQPAGEGSVELPSLERATPAEATPAAVASDATTALTEACRLTKIEPPKGSSPLASGTESQVVLPSIDPASATDQLTLPEPASPPVSDFVAVKNDPLAEACRAAKIPPPVPMSPAR